MEQTSHHPSNQFWIISILALIWNLLGLLAYLSQTFLSQKSLNALPRAEQYYFINTPAWFTAAFATAVFAGIFGSVGLLLKKRMANVLFIISMVSLLVQHYYNFFVQNYMKISDLKLVMPIATVVISIFLIWFTFKMSRKGVLN